MHGDESEEEDDDKLLYATAATCATDANDSNDNKSSNPPSTYRTKNIKKMLNKITANALGCFKL